ncbi:MAG TPA: amidohydrolase, partial [Candidatus Coatesbacteria bacterium]|nr:amidohydrolase [Candidatus Coatesbacteria bacterium]
MAERATAVVGARVHTVSGPVHEPGTVVIVGERIVAVGPESAVKVPEGATRIEARGMTLVPGLIDAHAHIGVFNEAQGEDNWDGNETTDPVTPEMRVIDALNPDAVAFPDVLAAGVTTVATMPGSANVIGGTAAAIRTRGATVNELVRAYPVGMKMALGYNPKSVYGVEKKRPATRMANAAVLRGALQAAKNYAAKKLHHGAQLLTMEKKEADKREPVAPLEVDLKLEALLPVLEGRLVARCHCHRADDILTALRIRDEFGLAMSLEHCTEGYKVAKELAEAGVTCVLGPHFIDMRYKAELMGVNPANAALLHAVGVKVCLQTDATWGVQWLAHNAALCVR